jgi:hypothetical protein
MLLLFLPFECPFAAFFMGSGQIYIFILFLLFFFDNYFQDHRPYPNLCLMKFMIFHIFFNQFLKPSQFHLFFF